jgi:hypothetical protein
VKSPNLGSARINVNLGPCKVHNFQGNTSSFEIVLSCGKITTNAPKLPSESPKPRVRVKSTRNGVNGASTGRNRSFPTNRRRRSGNRHRRSGKLPSTRWQFDRGSEASLQSIAMRQFSFAVKSPEALARVNSPSARTGRALVMSLPSLEHEPPSEDTRASIDLQLSSLKIKGR